MAGDKLSRVKSAMEELNNSVDAAEDRALEADQFKREAIDRLEKAEEEAESYRRRFKLIEADLEKTRKTLEEKEQRLEQLESQCGGDDEKRREYEVIEMERDDELVVIEQECQTAKNQATEALHVLAEVERKAQVLEAELEKMNKRLADAESEEQRCLEAIERNGQELRDLESRDDDAANREMEAEEKLRFLEEQLKEQISRAENAERDVIRNENIVAGIHNDRNKILQDKESLDAEMFSIDEFAGALN